MEDGGVTSPRTVGKPEAMVAQVPTEFPPSILYYRPGVVQEFVVTV